MAPGLSRNFTTRLQLPTTSAPLAPARYPELQLDLAFDEQVDVDNNVEADSDIVCQTDPRNRAPPTASAPSHQPRDWTIDHDHDWGA